MSNYQIVIDGQDVSRPMDKEGADAWVVLLRVAFPGANIQAEPLTCPECGLMLPDSGPCWHNRFVEETVTSEEMLEALIPFQGEAFPAKVYSEFEEYF